MYKAVELLLARGADIEGEEPWRKTSLMCAVLNGQPYAVRVLLASGVDIDRACWGRASNVSPLKQARRREGVLKPGWKDFVADEVNSLFDVFLLARLIVAGRRSGPLAARAMATRAAAARMNRADAAAGPRRRVLGSKDLSRVIAKFLARKLLSEPEQ